MRILAARIPERAVPEAEPVNEPQAPLASGAGVSVSLPHSEGSLPSSPASKYNMGNSTAHLNAHSSQSLHINTHSTQLPAPSINKSVNGQLPTPASPSHIATASISITPLDADVTSSILSVLSKFILCRTGDIVGYANAVPATGGRRQSTTLNSTSLQPHTRLTPFPSVPLHGFEAFAPPALHEDSAGLLSQSAVWGVGTNTQLHQPLKLYDDETPSVATDPLYAIGSPSPSQRKDSRRNTYVRPYNSLYAWLDAYPPTLCFLPPSVLLARYAARCLYFLSKCNEGDGTDMFSRVSLGLEEGKEREGDFVMWDRIIGGTGRLAGVAVASESTEARRSGEFTNASYERVMDELEREKGRGKWKEKSKQKEKEAGSPKGRQRDVGGRFYRHRTAAARSVSAIPELGDYDPGQSRDGSEKGGRLGIGRQGEEDVTELRMLGFVAMRKGALSGLVRGK